jgi:exopolysaccharide biosynthesis polyprenyl glycosylphosphotransferase
MGLEAQPATHRNERGSVGLGVRLAASLPSTRARAEGARRGLRSRGHVVEGSAVLLSEAVSLLVVAVLTNAATVAVLWALAAPVWHARSLYARRFSLSLLDDVAPLCAGISIAAAPTLLVGPALMRSSSTSLEPREFWSTLAAFAVGVVAARGLAYRALLVCRRTGRLSYPTLIVGSGPVAVSLAQRMEDHPESGMRPVGFLEQGPARRRLPGPLLGLTSDLPRLLTEVQVTDVVVADSRTPTAELVEVLRRCDRLDIEIHVLPRLFELHRPGAGCDHVCGLPLTRVRRRAHRTLGWRLKRAMDVTVAAMALLLLSPVMLLTALAVRVELGPGVLFSQARVGLDGKAIVLWKFRSMRSCGPSEETPWSVRSPERVGPVGRFIRRYSVDELPQLVSVLRGDMSLVGPRPERPEYVARFSAELPRYRDRHRVPVGLTGLAAVQGLRGDTSLRERVFFDNLYIDNWSLGLDLKILIRTALVVVRGTGS